MENVSSVDLVFGAPNAANVKQEGVAPNVSSVVVVSTMAAVDPTRSPVPLVSPRVPSATGGDSQVGNGGLGAGTIAGIVITAILAAVAMVAIPLFIERAGPRRVQCMSDGSGGAHRVAYEI